MKNVRSWGAVTLASLLLAACGGGGDGDQSPRVKYSAMVSFGDSLSDVGSYATTGLVAATHGGRYTVNSPTAKNWTELLAGQLGTGTPCAAQTGLESSGPLAGLAQAKADHAGCFGYAQGGARVTNPVGPGNKALLPGSTTGYVGQLTDPVVNQITRHLAASPGNVFSGSELVTVMAGGNDVFINLAAVSAGGATPTQAVTAMGQAGAELAGYIKGMILAKGATRVVVVNLPDVSQTPLAYHQSASVQQLISTMVTTFNGQLHAGLAGTAGVLEVDAYTQGRDQIARPQLYSLSNVTDPACDKTKSLFDSALVCSTDTTIAGDVSHYVFADDVHPTPFAYQLLAQFVAKRMVESGWL